MSMVNGSCPYKRTDRHVVTFFDDQVIIEDSKEFPHGTILVREELLIIIFCIIILKCYFYVN